MTAASIPSPRAKCGAQRPATTKAPADNPNPGNFQLLLEMSPGLSQVLLDPLGLIAGRASQTCGTLSVLADLAFIEIDGERHVAFGGKALGHRPHIVIETPPFVE